MSIPERFISCSAVLPHKSLSNAVRRKQSSDCCFSCPRAARCREIIAALGGSVIDDLSSETFSENATHKDPLMIIDPDKNRVFKKKSVLQQLASGGWILEPLYLEDSETKGHFLNEEDYVVGIGPKSSKFNDSRFACLQRWRQLRLERGTGAFDGWKVVLFSASIEREKGHRTLLQAGGATVLTEDKLAEATHVFLAKGDSVTAKKVREKVSAGVKVLANEYMLHYLSNAEVSRMLIESNDDRIEADLGHQSLRQ